MKFGIISEGYRITAVISDGIPMGDGCTVVETDLTADVILTECALISGELVRVGPMPAPFMVYDPNTGGWKDARTIADLKAAKHATVKAVRDISEFSQFTYNGMVFDGDAEAQRRLSGVVSAAKSAIAAGYSFTKDFTLADNTVVQLTAEDFIGIEMAKLWQVDVAFQEYRLKKAAIEAAATLEELEAITI